ncbi:MAG: hypothetical protein KDA24_03065 [Deltaproteobacteria bacterium]|nr:hypothetical protein [Deltaproteobacteria bacterium]
MTRLFTIFLAVSMLALAGCGSDAEPPATPVEAPPAADEAPAAAEPPAAEEAPAAEAVDPMVTLALAIRANPADAGKLLADAGMSVDQFEAAMYDLARDPAKSAAFASALK